MIFCLCSSCRLSRTLSMTCTRDGCLHIRMMMMCRLNLLSGSRLKIRQSFTNDTKLLCSTYCSMPLCTCCWLDAVHGLRCPMRIEAMSNSSKLMWKTSFIPINAPTEIVRLACMSFHERNARSTYARPASHTRTCSSALIHLALKVNHSSGCASLYFFMKMR